MSSTLTHNFYFNDIAVVDQYDDPSHIVQYELSTYPPAFFDGSGMMREANKPQLADSMWDMAGNPNINIPETDVRFVLDGGTLLQRIPWSLGATYNSICKIYVQYVQDHFGKEAVIVFDGYEQGPTTKDSNIREEERN